MRAGEEQYATFSDTPELIEMTRQTPRHAVYTSPPVSRGDPGVVRLWAVLLLILVMRAACFIPAGVLIMSDMLIIFVNPRHIIPVHLYIVAPTFVQFCSLPPNSAVIGCTTPYFCPQSANTVTALQKVCGC